MICEHCNHEFNPGETAKAVKMKAYITEQGVIEVKTHHVCEKCFIEWVEEKAGIEKTYHVEVKHG